MDDFLAFLLDLPLFPYSAAQEMLIEYRLLLKVLYFSLLFFVLFEMGSSIPIILEELFLVFFLDFFGMLLLKLEFRKLRLSDGFPLSRSLLWLSRRKLS